MPTLQVDLQEGFEHDEVELVVNGRGVFSKPAVTTRLLLGFAESARVTVDAGPTVVEIAVRSRGLSLTERLDVQEDTFLGASVRADGLRVIVSETPFGYA